jgi:BioD-like phosphotransacetylase family protein
MKGLYIGSTSSYSGKTLLCLGLGFRFREKGIRIGYFKPLGRTPKLVQGVLTDEDAIYLKDALGLEEPLESICPIVLTQDLMARGLQGKPLGLLSKVREAYQRIGADKDLVLVGGSGRFHEGTFLGASGFQVIQNLDLQVLLVDPYKQDESLDGILAIREVLGERLVGVVLNRIPQHKLEEVMESAIPFLGKHNIRVVGVLPFDRLLSSMTIKQLHEILGGQVLCCEEKMEEPIETFTIGAMSVENALNYFRKIHHKAVITGGSRADIQLAALDTSTRCLVLTGDQMPSDLILDKARSVGVPVLLVKEDTLTVVEKFENMLGKVRIRTTSKVERAKRLIRERVEFDFIQERMGLSSS